jgi:hypothetical protein
MKWKISEYTVFPWGVAYRLVVRSKVCHEIEAELLFLSQARTLVRAFRTITKWALAPGICSLFDQHYAHAKESLSQGLKPA